LKLVFSSSISNSGSHHELVEFRFSVTCLYDFNPKMRTMDKIVGAEPYIKTIFQATH